MNHTMDNREKLGYVVLDAAISYHVTADSKRDAIEVAKYRLSDNKIQIQHVDLVNEHGVQQSFRLEKIDKWEWTGVELGQYSGRYNVVGHARFTLTLEGVKEKNAAQLLQSEYRLPPSAIHDHSFWVIPTLSGPAFICVRKHSVEWKVAQGEDVFFKVG